MTTDIADASLLRARLSQFESVWFALSQLESVWFALTRCWCARFEALVRAVTDGKTSDDEIKKSFTQLADSADSLLSTLCTHICGSSDAGVRLWCALLLRRMLIFAAAEQGEEPEETKASEEKGLPLPQSKVFVPALATLLKRCSKSTIASMAGTYLAAFVNSELLVGFRFALTVCLFWI